jgi:hypothetical protein
MSWADNTTDVSGVSRLGQVNESGDKRNLFLKQFAGEVLTTFEEKNIFMPLHRVRTIKNGKSAQFPSIGTASAAYHTAGKTIFGDGVKASEITVTVDDLLVSSTFIPKIDEAMNHYDVRSIYSKEMGNALANAADKHIASVIYKAATGSGTGDQTAQWSATDAVWAQASGSETAGTLALDAAAGTVDGDDIVSGIINALEVFETADVTGEKYCVLTPALYYKLMGTNNNAINRDLGGNGSIALGQVPTVGGVKVIMSNHLPTANGMEIVNGINDNDGTANSSGTSQTDYTQHSTALGGLMFTKDAAATVKLLDLGVESEYQINRQGTLMVAKYAMGHNVLRNKAAIAFTTAANT